MRVSQQLLAILLLFYAAISPAQEEELPPLELLGFIADFSDGNDWVDPENLEGLFNDNVDNSEQPQEVTEGNSEKQDEHGE
jgi:hypothetical protein